VDCNGNDDAPDDNLNEGLTDLETPKYEETDEAYMDACLERSCHKQLVVRRLIRCAHAATLRAKSRFELAILPKL
jgi:hypothetical protein